MNTCTLLSQTPCSDQVSNRALPHQVTVNGDMTIEKCTSKCSQEGYPLSGLEFSSECFCGTAISSPKVDDGCTMSCSGDSTEICGGSDRLSVYKHNGREPTQVPSVGDWKLDGCFV